MTRQLTVPKEQNAEAVVWASLFLSNYTIVTGDSAGKVTFYDGKLGSLLNSFKIHDADVLSLATTKTERQGSEMRSKTVTNGTYLNSVL